MPPQVQLTFQIGNLLVEVCNLPLALDQFLPQFLNLAVQQIILAPQLVQLYGLFWPTLVMRCLQTSTLPGFSPNSRVQSADS